MSVDKDTVRRIARLARLALEEERVEPMVEELNGILAWVEQLKEVDVEGVAPMTSVVEQTPQDARRCGDRRRQCRCADGQCAGRRGSFLRRAEGGGVDGAAEQSRRISPWPKRATPFAAKKISSSELTAAFVKAVEEARPLNAFVTETPETALAMAAASDARIAHGRGARRSRACRWRSRICSAPRACARRRAARSCRNFVPPYESTVTQNLWDAGAVMLGKTNMDEFAMGSSNETSYFGPVFNPWRATQFERAIWCRAARRAVRRRPLPANLCLAATGTDTGGSIRQPAAVTGTVGLKPTYGRCSRWGIVAFASSLDQAGPMTRTVRDAAIMLKAHGERRPQGFHQRRRAGAGL